MPSAENSLGSANKTLHKRLGLWLCVRRACTGGCTHHVHHPSIGAAPPSTCAVFCSVSFAFSFSCLLSFSCRASICWQIGNSLGMVTPVSGCHLFDFHLRRDFLLFHFSCFHIQFIQLRRSTRLGSLCPDSGKDARRARRLGAPNAGLVSELPGELYRLLAFLELDGAEGRPGRLLGPKGSEESCPWSAQHTQFSVQLSAEMAMWLRTSAWLGTFWNPRLPPAI